MPNLELNEPIDIKLDYMETLIVAGYSQSAAVQHCDSTCGWGVSKRWLRDLYQRAFKRMSEGAKTIDRAAYATRHLLRMDAVYKAAMDAGKFNAAVQAELRVARLLRLDDPERKIDWAAKAEQLGLDPDKIYTQLFGAAVAVSDEIEIEAD